MVPTSGARNARLHLELGCKVKRDQKPLLHLNQIRNQVKAPLCFLCENPLEKTDFKSGFAGVPPSFHDDERVFTMSVRKKVKLAGYYATRLLSNPRYFNASLVDSTLAFAFCYLIRRDYSNLYRYIHWEEDRIVSTLTTEYDFELSPDTQTTWRIGDGTAAFYNYIYYVVAGLTENETFRSNQIRLGVLSRDEALKRIERENRPRFATILWYLKTIGLKRELDDVLAIINSIPKLYDLSHNG